MRFISMFVLAALLFLSSCNMGGKRVRGNGNIRTEERSVSDFSRIEVNGAVKLYVSQGSLKPVKIETDENLLPYVELIDEGDKLVIRTRNGYNLNSTGDMKVYVTAPVYKGIEVSGACDIIGETKIAGDESLKLHVSGAGEMNMEIDAPGVDASISGSGSVKLKGETKRFDLDLSGAANARCFDLLSENTKVEISGAGDAEVYASVKLDAQVSGAGSVRYKGNAQDIKQHVSGAGSVSKR